jgi:hypothetical protein
MNDIFGLIFILKLFFVPWGHSAKENRNVLKVLVGKYFRLRNS